jgi:hypothetical protein
VAGYCLMRSAEANRDGIDTALPGVAASRCAEAHHNRSAPMSAY